jgi:hypothetical protein
MVEGLEFTAEGKVKADIEIRPLSRVASSFDRLGQAICRHAWSSSLRSRRATEAARSMAVLFGLS